MRIHASCAALDGAAVLLLGPPGSGKSDLLLRLLGRGWALVADDQVELTPGGDGPPLAAAPAALRGLLEVRGVGVFEGLDVPPAPLPLRLAASLGPDVPRLPLPGDWRPPGVGSGAVPHLRLAGLEASAPDKLALALAAATGRRAQRAGAFAA